MGAVNTTYTFTATDTITSTKMNNIIDETVMTSDSCLAGGGLEVASGKLSISANAINSSRIANNAVTENAILNGAVTPAKFSAFGPAWSNNLNNFNIQQNSLELSTGITSNSSSFIDFHSVHPLTDYECRLFRDQGPNGWFAIQNTGSGAISLQSAGGVQFANANMPNPAGNAPIYGVRAWVNFEGRATNGSCTIRSSGNVSSVSRTAAGKYTVTFVTAMPNTNYLVIANSGSSPGSPRFACADRSTITTTTVKIETDSVSGSATDFNENNVMVIA